MTFLESGFSAVAILGGGWLQSPASDGPPLKEGKQKAMYDYMQSY